MYHILSSISWISVSPRTYKMDITNLDGCIAENCFRFFVSIGVNSWANLCKSHQDWRSWLWMRPICILWGAVFLSLDLSMPPSQIRVIRRTTIPGSDVHEHWERLLLSMNILYKYLQISAHVCFLCNEVIEGDNLRHQAHFDPACHLHQCLAQVVWCGESALSNDLMVNAFWTHNVDLTKLTANDTEFATNPEHLIERVIIKRRVNGL